MSNLKTNLIFLLASVIISSGTYAQGQLSLFTEIGIPTGEFRKNTSEEGFGFGLGFAIPVFKSKTFFVGGDLNYELYGKRATRDRINGLRIVTNNNVFMTHAFFRYKPLPEATVSPYVEVLGGFKALYTITKIREDILSEAIESYQEHSDLVWSHGSAAGIQIRLKYWLSLDVSALYLKSGDAKYIDKQGITDDGNGNLSFSTKRSRTNMAVIRIGLTFDITKG